MSNNPRETTASAKSPNTSPYRLVNREQGNNYIDLRIEAIHPRRIKPSDIELRVNRLAGTLKDCYERCKYDFLQVEWPGNADSKVTDLLLRCVSSCDPAGPDRLKVVIPGPIEMLTISKGGEEQTSVFGEASWLVDTTFHTLENRNGVACVIAGCVFRLTSDLVGFWEKPPPDSKLNDWQFREVKQETLHEILTRRNQLLELPLPHQLSEHEHKEPLPAKKFYFHTSQEMDLWHRAQCDGQTFSGYFINNNAGAITYERSGAPHKIELSLTEDERTAGLALSYLETLVRKQDADAVIATEYILGVLTPPPHLPPRPYAGGWIDFDDVIKKIGWIPRNTKDRREMHAQIWGFVKYGERAHIIGKRTGAKYRDAEGKEIDTTIHGAAWRVMKTETPDQPSLYTALETPVRAEIVVSRELTALLTSPATAQYLQGAEILGAIPGGKPSGAWARVIGLALANFWRRKPREVIAGTLKPTRRELLDHYTAKIAPYEEVFASDKPGRVIEYWCGALQILADEGFIERTGEAAITAKSMRDGLPRQNWQDIWLDQSVNIAIGAKIKAVFDERVAALPALKPRDLKRKRRTKRTPK